MVKTNLMAFLFSVILPFTDTSLTFTEAKKPLVRLWEFGEFLEVRLAFFEECILAFLRLVREIIQQCSAACKLLQTSTIQTC